MTTNSGEEWIDSPEERLREANILINAGLTHIYPVGAKKTPIGEWGRYVTNQPTREEIENWARKRSTKGWAILCGNADHKIFTLDIERDGLEQHGDTFWPILNNLPDTCQRPSANFGQHAVLRITQGDAVPSQNLARNSTGQLLAEIRGVSKNPNKNGHYAMITGPGRGRLSETFTPHPIARDEAEQLLNKIRELDAHAHTQPSTDSEFTRLKPRGHLPSTNTLLSEAIQKGTLNWLQCLDDGWSIATTSSDRITYLRPNYNEPAKSETSANWAPEHGAVLTIWSGNVPWADATNNSYGPGTLIAAAHFNNNYKQAMQHIEQQARSLIENGEAPTGFMHDWPTELLHAIHQNRLEVNEKTSTTHATHLTDDFWNSHPKLQEIRQHADATGIRPEIQLGAVLAVVNARIPAHYVIPPINGSHGSLNLLIATLGRPGLGKSSAQRNAYELTNTHTGPYQDDTYIPNDQQPLNVITLGSGEGIVSAYYEWTQQPNPHDETKKPQRALRRVRDTVLIADAEGSTLASHMNRTGSILAAVLLKLFSGEDPSATVTKRNDKPGSEPQRLPDLQYRAAVNIGIQPDIIKTFFELAGVGWPQRLLYFDAEGNIPRQRPPRPTITPWTPPPPTTNTTEINIPQTITDELQNRQYEYRQGHIDELSVHSGLVQLKTAATIHALLNPGQLVQITENDWELASHITSTSDATRAKAQQHINEMKRREEKARAVKSAQREVLIEETKLAGALVRVAKGIWRIVNKHHQQNEHEGTGCLEACLTRGLDSRDRSYKASAIAEAIQRDWIAEESTDEGNCRYVPGKSQPAADAS